MDDIIGAILPGIAELRHELHRHPEIRYEEEWTSDRLAVFLDGLGVPYKQGYAGGTGIIAELKGRPGKCVALRADIDALEITEATGLPYASEVPQRMHACGHDGHMACLCGAAQILAEMRDRLDGTIRFIFQPAEEQAAGGKRMAEEGAVDGVDAVFGLHGWPALPVGMVATKPGWLMASADMFEIEVTGKGCHGADPTAGIDPVVAAAHITTALQTIVAREVDPGAPAIVTVASINAGTSSNIIPDSAVMKGTIRAFDPEVFSTLQESVRRIATATAGALRATAEVRFGEEPYPAVCNDAAMTALTCDVAREVLGVDEVIELERGVMVAEDFAYYLQRVPGCFFFLGTNPNPDSPYPVLHSPQYDFPDQALPVGIRLLVTLAQRFLGSAS